MPIWTIKQKEYGLNANHRWNVKIGAVRSGKTFQDKEDIIARRIRERIGKDGLVILIGVTKSTIERNVLRPMRDKFGSSLVGNINNENKVKLFGEECYCLGAEKVNQVSNIQGASIKYLYGDEVVKWAKEVFDMLKSRLDQEYSIADLTGNPEQANHWFKEFLESNADIYCQEYTIFDNNFLPKIFVENLCKEYEGTVLYNRYILGQWCNAEGLIYTRFANEPTKYIWNKRKQDNTYDLPSGMTIIGIDYGGTKSGQAFVCTRISNDYKTIIVLGSERHTGDIDPDESEPEVAVQPVQAFTPVSEPEQEATPEPVAEPEPVPVSVPEQKDEPTTPSGEKNGGRLWAWILGLLLLCLLCFFQTYRFLVQASMLR